MKEKQIQKEETKTNGYKKKKKDKKIVGGK